MLFAPPPRALASRRLFIHPEISIRGGAAEGERNCSSIFYRLNGRTRLEVGARNSESIDSGATERSHGIIH